LREIQELQAELLQTASQVADQAVKAAAFSDSSAALAVDSQGNRSRPKWPPTAVGA